MNYWPLLGVLIVVVGFVLRYNPVIVVVVAGLVSGLVAGKSIPDLLALLGTSFVSNRALLLLALTLPTIGLLERAGLREHAHAWIGRMKGLTLVHLLIGYLGVRQGLSMIGLHSIGGPAQTVRPLLAPMSEAAAEKSLGPLPNDERQKLFAVDAATDNVGLFFGEDVFVAIGAVLLIQGFFAQNGIVMEPLHIALWAAPTAVVAFVIHSIRVHVFAQRLAVRMASHATAAAHDPSAQGKSDAGH